MMIQMMRYLIRNKSRYFRYLLKTFAPVIAIMAIFIGAFIYTNGNVLLNIFLSNPLAHYRTYFFAILSIVMLAVGLFSGKSGIHIYHATLHYFFNTNYFFDFLLIMYLKKFVGCMIGSSVLSLLVSESVESFIFICASTATYIFSMGMLQWFKFNSKKKTKWIIIGFVLSGLFAFYQENYLWIGILGLIVTLIYTQYLHIDYTKWMEECSFIDEASFASAKQDVSRMYHVQSIVKAHNLHKVSYPLWKLSNYNNVVQKTIIKIMRESKRIWVIWSIPFIISIALKILWIDFPYTNLVMGFGVCFFLSGINQYLYNDLFELLNKASKGLFLPYGSALIIMQGMAVPAVVFFALSIVVLIFLHISVEKAFLLCGGWIVSFLLLILYRMFRGNPGRFVIAVQSAVIVGLTFWAVI